MSSLIAVARRRWTLVLLGIVVSAGLAFGGYQLARPSYQATASVFMLPPASTVPADGNPLLQLGGLDLAVDLLAKSLQDQAVTAQVEDVSPTAQVEVAADPSSSGPILRIQVRDKSEAAALQVRDMLVGMAPTRLADLQTEIGVKGRNRVTTSVLVSDAVAEPVGRDKLVGGVVGGAIGLGFSALAIALIDNILVRRARRRSSVETHEDPESSSEQPAADGHAAEPEVEVIAAETTSDEGVHPSHLDDDATGDAPGDESALVAPYDASTDDSATSLGFDDPDSDGSETDATANVANTTTPVAPNGQAADPARADHGLSQGARSGDPAT